VAPAPAVDTAVAARPEPAPAPPVVATHDSAAAAPLPPDSSAQDQSLVIAAAGDIAISGGDQKATAGILTGLLHDEKLGLILMLGDGAYRFATMTEYQAWYEPTWGVPALKAITRAIPGNHEYLMQRDAHGYFDYWNGVGKDDGPAGPRGKGYYSFDMGGWHFIALNTNEDCKWLPCGEGSAQLAFLKADLASHSSFCTLLYHHNPRYQDGTHRGDTPALQPAWAAAYDAGVDLVLAAHEHNFQQFAPMDAAGNVDRVRGMRSFVLGTGGGQDFRAVFTTAHMAAEEKRLVNTSGILELVLHPRDYDWKFLTIDGKVFSSGHDVCH
jgi:hypothetical protein